MICDPGVDHEVMRREYKVESECGKFTKSCRHEHYS